MADLCFQCNIDLYFGPHSDFDHVHKPGDDPLPEGFGYIVICEGCGVIAVDERGHCISTDCLSHHAAVPPERREVYESAQRWVARRSGPLGPLLRLRDRYLGTPWEPGYIHFPGHWLWYLVELYRSLRDDRPMERAEDIDKSLIIFNEGFELVDYDSELNDNDLGPL